MSKKIIAFGILGLLGLTVGSVALAIGEVPPATIPSTVTSANNFIDLLNNIVNWIFVVVMVFAVIFIVLAGFQFITGGGEPQQVSQARNKLLYAAIGIMVAVLARGLVTAVRSLIGS